MRIASIGQEIMQAERPKAIIAPLQIGLGGVNAQTVRLTIFD